MTERSLVPDESILRYRSRKSDLESLRKEALQEVLDPEMTQYHGAPPPRMQGAVPGLPSPRLWAGFVTHVAQWGLKGPRDRACPSRRFLECATSDNRWGLKKTILETFTKAF